MTHFKITPVQEYIPVGRVPPLVTVRGVSITETPGQRPLPQTETPPPDTDPSPRHRPLPQTEIPPPDRDPSPGQGSLPRTEIPPERDPAGPKPPGQRPSSL